MLQQRPALDDDNDDDDDLWFCEVANGHCHCNLSLAGCRLAATP